MIMQDRCGGPASTSVVVGEGSLACPPPITPAKAGIQGGVNPGGYRSHHALSGGFYHLKSAFPAKAGIHLSGDGAIEEWVPAFPTDQVRGLKAHGNADSLNALRRPKCRAA